MTLLPCMTISPIVLPVGRDVGHLGVHHAHAFGLDHAYALARLQQRHARRLTSRPTAGWGWQTVIGPYVSVSP